MGSPSLVRRGTAQSDTSQDALRQSNRRDVLTAVPQHPRHPNKLVQKLTNSASVILIQKISLFVEYFPNRSKVHIRKSDYEAQLTHDLDKLLDHTASTESAGRYSANSDCFVDVLLQIHI